MKTTRTNFLFVILLLLALAAAMMYGRRLLPDTAYAPAAAPEALFPEWNGEPSVIYNGNIPSFDKEELTDICFTRFSEQDALGRCGAALACVGKESFPEGERTSIGMIRPAGWHLAKYDFIDNGGFLYNRCHLIAWMLCGVGDDVRNLITGTRYLNTEGMLPYEKQIADYIRKTGNHVFYRVTPLYAGNDLLARGVQMEAMSVEDEGKSLSFNVFCFNVQPSVTIDYATGNNHL